jgi:hypothetical protein
MAATIIGLVTLLGEIRYGTVRRQLSPKEETR